MLDELVGGPALGAEVLPGVGVLLVGGDLGDPLVSTVTSTPHEARQYRQKVCTVRVLMRSSCPKCSAVGAVKRIAYSLGLGHGPVFTATGEQFLMATALDDLARSITRMTSASRIVESRCAIMKLVRSRRSSTIAY
jgi:hypothetical protein